MLFSCVVCLCYFRVFIGLYLNTPRYRFGYSIHIPKAKEYRYFHGKLGCEVHLLRPPLISHQVSSSCGLVGKDILTSIRNNPRMLHDENELTKIIEWATSKQRLLEKVTSAFYCLQFFFVVFLESCCFLTLVVFLTFVTFFHIFNLASTISESQVEYIKVHLETWNVNHKSKFGFQDGGIKKVGLGNLDCEAHCPNSIFD